jgi:hypothetical protein
VLTSRHDLGAHFLSIFKPSKLKQRRAIIFPHFSLFISINIHRFSTSRGLDKISTGAPKTVQFPSPLTGRNLRPIAK